ncbi:MAG: hypothetical protein K9J16_06805 [Melioribacteraceae bacterium]|nr:hypothetical protein [Melioribacteraceae bacterium]MCF8354502.1 hypothetical protein [Melioribacteraceae bacterium]MCF8394271.1 hypothetical protein [Melioribacteraceae bacterium]MCF8418171.1 hypothetical protein [Melioribacteraceae bacterium]
MKKEQGISVMLNSENSEKEQGFSVVLNSENSKYLIDLSSKTGRSTSNILNSILNHVEVVLPKNRNNNLCRKNEKKISRTN